MSRLAKKPIAIPAGVKIDQTDHAIKATGKKGDLSLAIHPSVGIHIEDNLIQVSFKNNTNGGRGSKNTKHPMVGTTAKLIQNLITGVSNGFEKKIILHGVGFRGKVQGNTIELSLGYSHPVVYTAPKGITIAMPSPTEIVITGADRDQVGEVAAKIHRFRKRDAYKGKGPRYSDEDLKLKETKKK